MNDRFYRSASVRFGQGDIFADVPSVVVVEPERVDPLDLGLSDASSLWRPVSDTAAVKNAVLERSFAILLTHGCELDKPTPSHVLMATVRPLSSVPNDRRGAIRGARVKRTMPLPENDDPYFPESYVDFSRVTSVAPEVIASAQRILSPSDELPSALYTALTVYFTRLELVPEVQRQAVEEAVRQANTPQS